jgi:HEAT repeat protein
LKEALYGPPNRADQKIDPANHILYAIPVEKRVAALEMVLEALRDGNKHVCLRAIRLIPLIWPQGETALPILFDLIRTKSGEWPEVASAAMIAAAQARPKPDIVPEMVRATMQGPPSAHRALASIFPLAQELHARKRSVF